MDGTVRRIPAKGWARDHYSDRSGNIVEGDIYDPDTREDRGKYGFTQTWYDYVMTSEAQPFYDIAERYPHYSVEDVDVGEAADWGVDVKKWTYRQGFRWYPCHVIHVTQNKFVCEIKDIYGRKHVAYVEKSDFHALRQKTTEKVDSEWIPHVGYVEKLALHPGKKTLTEKEESLFHVVVNWGMLRLSIPTNSPMTEIVDHYSWQRPGYLTEDTTAPIVWFCDNGLIGSNQKYPPLEGFTFDDKFPGNTNMWKWAMPWYLRSWDSDLTGRSWIWMNTGLQKGFWYLCTDHGLLLKHSKRTLGYVTLANYKKMRKARMALLWQSM